MARQVGWHARVTVAVSGIRSAGKGTRTRSEGDRALVPRTASADEIFNYNYSPTASSIGSTKYSASSGQVLMNYHT